MSPPAPAGRPAPILVAEGIEFGYGETAFLRGIGLRLDPGECVALLGANGAGKTTLLRILAGARRPSAGIVELEGDALSSLAPSERARRFGFLPQAIPPAEGFAVFEVVLMGLYATLPARGWESREEWRAVARALRRVGAAGLLRRPFGELSGGEQRRVLLARAMVAEPRLLLLDEPLASLDPGFGLELLERLTELRAAGTSMVLASHDLGLVRTLADRVILLREGRSLGTGSVPEMLTAERLDETYATDAFGRRAVTAGQTWLPPSRV